MDKARHSPYPAKPPGSPGGLFRFFSNSCSFRGIAVEYAGSYDIVIAGGGMAGMTAALFAARYGHPTLMVERQMPGGHLVNAEKIEDFPGFLGSVGGFDLCPSVQEQAETAGAEFALAEVTGVENDPPYWVARTRAGDYRAKALIIALGSRPRSLGIPGEDKFMTRGVSHCASCDGPFYQDQVVGVVGGGDSALQEALVLAGYASRVIVFHRRDIFRAQQAWQERVRENPKIEVRLNTVVEEILGDDEVTGVRVRNAAIGSTSTVELAGLFVYTGVEPETGILEGLVPLDSSGHIITDLWMRTGREGLFAAGDIRSEAAGQAVTAAGDGATAAIAAHRYIAGRDWPAG